MTRAALLLALVLAAQPAFAQDGGADPAPLAPQDQGGDGEKPRRKPRDDDKGGKGDKGGDEKPDPEKEKQKALAKVLDAIADEFKAANVKALMARVPKGRSVRLGLGAEEKDKSYEKAQAQDVLKVWFDRRTIKSVKRANVTGTTGKYTLEYRNNKKGREETKALLITVTSDGQGGHDLTELRVE